ncbi:mitochondrial ribosomal protein L48 isoform X2 [Nomia melanderi]|uniref:mitochondrial ribosomal protein L48 isoform X2 n=1 Tax=Nomia melanderi TaxID=2448451 RepID=UPI003FCE57A7
MALNVMKQVATHYHRSLVNKAVRFYSIYTPPYLSIKTTGPQLYPILHIQIKGYTYPLLESFQSFIAKVANNLDIDVDESFAMPHQEHKYKASYQKSTQLEDICCQTRK